MNCEFCLRNTFNVGILSWNHGAEPIQAPADEGNSCSFALMNIVFLFLIILDDDPSSADIRVVLASISGAEAPVCCKWLALSAIQIPQRLPWTPSVTAQPVFSLDQLLLSSVEFLILGVKTQAQRKRSSPERRSISKDPGWPQRLNPAASFPPVRDSPTFQFHSELLLVLRRW